MQPLEVPAKLIGGTRGKPSFGVLLDCREAEQMLVTAFYADALSRIDNLAVRERFAAVLALRST